MRRQLAALLLALLPSGAGAETVTWRWSPHSAEETDALRLGLALYGLREEIRGGGTLRQSGRNNAAALHQSGGGNWGVIVQRGDGHRATLDQQGGGNAHAILQAGQGAEAEVVQGGGELGVTVQLGW